MKSAKEIRQDFIDFFKERDHLFVPSSPVIPQNDPTLLFTNAGMNQFKSIFLGDNPKNLKRVANTQKCMRVSGKHNDLEEVGVDHHHHTFFEMLGNWSFGDYYKKEAIKWAWELLTDVWKLPKDKLYATVYKDDDEAEKLWKSETDIDPSHISRHGKKDNFWEMGATGPCGPCSEIHLDTGPGTCLNENNPEHTCRINADKCSKYIEIWNLVFIQYNRGKDSSLIELPQKHVDTGMGFERIVRIVRNSDSNYSTDLFIPIINEVEKLCEKKYDTGVDGTPFRVIADHIRSLLFAVTDGAFPSNEGRGYVLRRILRRAYRFGRNLGFSEPFLYKLIPVTVDIMGEAFPEVTKRMDYVMQVVKSEEERFDQTLEQGLEKINQVVDRCIKTGKIRIPGSDVFTLYDTFGFPMDLTRLIASEQNLTIDEKEFGTLMASQKERARTAAKAASRNGLSAEDWIELKNIKGTEFTGYDNDEAEVIICRYKVTKPGTESGYMKEGLVVLDKTPFYAEMGGQAGDRGVLESENGTVLNVSDTIKWNDITVHKVKSDKQFPVSKFTDRFTARIESEQRLFIRRNHSATHLLQSALRQVLGDHVSQSGSRVAPDSLRFDFTHFKALSSEEIEKTEYMVNNRIMENLPVKTEVKATEDAKKEGATALFGEKYGKTVRVVSTGDISKELCGGTHVKFSGEIGLFHITSESSIAAGVRRIEAITGENSLVYLRKKESIVQSLTDMLKVNESKLVKRVEDIQSGIKKLEVRINDLSRLQAEKDIEKLLEKADDSGAFRWVVKNMGVVEKKDFSSFFNTASDTVRGNNLDTMVVFLSAVVDDKVLFAACSGNKAVSEYGIHCGELVKIAAKETGGSGGGSPVRAQAGGNNPSAIAKAVEVVKALLSEKAGKK